MIVIYNFLQSFTPFRNHTFEGRTYVVFAHFIIMSFLNLFAGNFFASKTIYVYFNTKYFFNFKATAIIFN